MIRIKLSALLVLSVVAVTLFSCRKESLSGNIDRGETYYPYAEGLWWEYDVDSIWYNDFSGDTVHATFILREEFDTFFVANDGNMAIRIERYRKANENAPWQGPRIWWTYITNDYAVKVEENNAFVKLNYPAKQGAKWNGNRLNFMEAWNYTYESVDQPLSLNGHGFDSTTSVLQKNYETLLERQFYKEKYARRVGLVEKTVIDVRGFIDSDNIPDTIVKPLMNRIKSGVVITQRIRDWGVM